MSRKDFWANQAQRRNEWADKAEAKAEAMFATRTTDYAFITQPGHIPARARENERMERAFEILTKARQHREKARNLEAMASRSKGDAERRKEIERAACTLQPGDKAVSVHFGACEIVKVNGKTYRVRLASGSVVTQDKRYIRAA